MGIQYIVTSFVFFLVGGIFAMIIRGELITPEADLLDRTVYNAMFTLHGTVMLFLWTFPVLVGLSNYLVPLMIGAKDMAFPRLKRCGLLDGAGLWGDPDGQLSGTGGTRPRLDGGPIPP